MIFRLENLSSEPPCVGKARHSENKNCIFLNGFKRGSEPHSFLSLINFNAFSGVVIAVTKMILCTQILKLVSPSTGKPELSLQHPSLPICNSKCPRVLPAPLEHAAHTHPPDPVLGTYQGDPGRMKGALSTLSFSTSHPTLHLREGKAQSTCSHRWLPTGSCRVLLIPSSEKGVGSSAYPKGERSKVKAAFGPCPGH